MTIRAMLALTSAPQNQSVIPAVIITTADGQTTPSYSSLLPAPPPPSFTHTPTVQFAAVKQFWTHRRIARHPPPSTLIVITSFYVLPGLPSDDDVHSSNCPSPSPRYQGGGTLNQSRKKRQIWSQIFHSISSRWRCFLNSPRRVASPSGGVRVFIYSSLLLFLPSLQSILAGLFFFSFCSVSAFFFFFFFFFSCCAQVLLLCT